MKALGCEIKPDCALLVLATLSHKVREHKLEPQDGYPVALLQPSFIEKSLEYQSLFEYVKNATAIKSHRGKKRKNKAEDAPPPGKKAKKLKGGG